MQEAIIWCLRGNHSDNFVCLSKSIGSRNKIDTTPEFPKFVSLIDCLLRPNHLDHQPVADVEELVLAWPQSGHQGSASLRVLAPVEAVQLSRHPVEVVIRVPGEKMIRVRSQFSSNLLVKGLLHLISMYEIGIFSRILFYIFPLVWYLQEDFKVRGWEHRD